MQAITKSGSGQDIGPTNRTPIAETGKDIGRSESRHSSACQVVTGSSAQVGTGTQVADTHTEEVCENHSSPTDSKVSDPQAAVKFTMVRGPQEILRKADGTSEFSETRVRAVVGNESNLNRIIERSHNFKLPLREIPIPTHPISYGSTADLFNRIKSVMATQTLLSPKSSSLLAYWVLSTWVSESLSLAPCLVITGSAFEGDLVLRTLKPFCRHPFLLSGVKDASLIGLRWELSPTPLISTPLLTKQVAALIGNSTQRGYLVGTGENCKDLFGPKAVYVGETFQSESTPAFRIEINATPTSLYRTGYPEPLSAESQQVIQNQLLGYRLENLATMHTPNLYAPSLSPETMAVANALGSCVFDSPQLQSELVALLAPLAEHEMGNRSLSLEAVVVEATLGLLHQGKTDVIFVKDIANEVKEIEKSRGVRSMVGAEKVGHKLKKLGLYTRRLSSAGNGLRMDEATQLLLHEVAEAYGNVGLEMGSSNLHCAYCSQNQ